MCNGRKHVASVRACFPADGRMRELPTELVLHVLRGVPLRELLTVRQCSRTLLHLVRQDPRWLPVIAPPTLAYSTLSLKEHGCMLIRLYARYEEWLKTWEDDVEQDLDDEVRYRSTALDGFFALAPWTPLANDDRPHEGEAWFPTPWMQRPVYGPQVPLAARGLLGGRRRSGRLAEPSPDREPSRFFQQRETMDDHNAQELPPPSTPVGLSRVHDCRRYSRFVVQPLDVFHFGVCWQLSDNVFNSLPIAQMLLQCYLPADTVHMAPQVGFTCASYSARPDGHTPGDFCVYRPAPDDFNANTFVMLLVASALDHDSMMANVFPDELGPYACPWFLPRVASMVEIEQALQHSALLRARCLTSLLLFCVLTNGVGLEKCENEPCALNECNHCVGALACTSLLLCPCCMRKLQIAGAVSDVPGCLASLHAVLSDSALKPVSARDLATLREWGHGQAGSSSDPVPVAE